MGYIQGRHLFIGKYKYAAIIQLLDGVVCNSINARVFHDTQKIWNKRKNDKMPFIFNLGRSVSDLQMFTSCKESQKNNKNSQTKVDTQNQKSVGIAIVNKQASSIYLHNTFRI